MFTTKAQLVSALKEQLKSKLSQAIHGLLVIYDKQTTDEKDDGIANHKNGVGFTSLDADFLTSLAEQYKAKGYLTAGQQKALFKAIPKYASQLIENSIAQGKIRKENGVYVW